MVIRSDFVRHPEEARKSKRQKQVLGLAWRERAGNLQPSLETVVRFELMTSKMAIKSRIKMI